MNLSKKDSVFFILLVVILVLLFAGTRKKLGTVIPDNKEHVDFYQQLENGTSRIVLEKGCIVCHELATLPQAHPHKEECMVCHRRQ